MDKIEIKKSINISRRLLLETNLTEKQICNQLYISQTKLRNMYNFYFGYPPQKYIRTIKMKKAQTLIRITNKNISDIAYELGYTNASKFSAAFKNIYGITPSKYKEDCCFGVENKKNNK